MTAVPGVGALALPPDDDDWPPPLLEPPEEPADEGAGEDAAGGLSLSCCANGSLLAKRLKDDSWPSGDTGTDARDGSDGVVPGASLPPSVGAARLGVPAVVVVAPAGFSL